MAMMFVVQIMLVGLAAGLAGLAIFGWQPLWRKVAALALCAGLIGTGYAAVVELLGRPKPSQLSAIVSADASVTVVASHLREGEAIYLWLLGDDNTEPMSFVLPWKLETARKLRRAGLDAEAKGTGIRMSRDADNATAKGAWVFHAEPVESLPPKRTPG